MLEDKVDQHAATVDKYHDPIANYQMSTRDYVLRPIANHTTGAFTITLPPVADAKGRFYSIVARTADVANTITIEDHDNDSECWGGDLTLNGKCDRALLYSDGLTWHVVSTLTFSDTAAPSTAAPTTATATTAAPTTASS